MTRPLPSCSRWPSIIRPTGDVLASYGKAQAAAGQLDRALDTIRRAQTPDQPDWKLLSAEGAILDQLGQSSAARANYRKALDLVPEEPSVLSNLGMSYVLSGDLPTAETHLKKAVAAPGADSRVRQNLSLVVGLQGRFAEAEQIARAELSPEAGGGQHPLPAHDDVAAECLGEAQRQGQGQEQHQLTGPDRPAQANARPRPGRFAVCRGAVSGARAAALPHTASVNPVDRRSHGHAKAPGQGPGAGMLA